MWRSGASEAIGRFLPPSCKSLQRACRPQTVIKLPKKKYTPKQDVQLGKEAASEVRTQYPIIEDQHIAKYLTQIGNRLVAAAPTELKQSVYEYSFTPVNLKDTNAFAPPGGPMFVRRGMFDAAAEEAEVAGVMAHELSRVLLRHGTANASKAQSPWLQLGQIAGAVGGAVVGGELGGCIAEGTQFGLGTLLLRYSRDDEKQADLLGAQIRARAGYDPRGLAHAPSRSASIRLNKTATWFQMALFWSTKFSFDASSGRKYSKREDVTTVRSNAFPLNATPSGKNSR
jgi:predicted Zn-dependent protease